MIMYAHFGLETHGLRLHTSYHSLENKAPMTTINLKSQAVKGSLRTLGL
jgi:hypothetical protein